ncbi:MAG: serine hydrolase [Alphaproteobacteria bacterium]|nr:serine hydrolase [Alphaproteobacteria bacterium]
MKLQTCLLGVMAALCLNSTAATAQPIEQSPTPEPQPVSNTAEYERFFDTFYRAQDTELDMAGTVVVLVEGDEIVFSRGYGSADAAGTRPVDPATTLFRNGSVSKLFTWTAVMQLVELGLIDLDTDVNAYLAGTDIQIPDTYAEPVTMRHLLTHTAGFEDGTVGILFARDESELVPTAQRLAETMPDRVRPAGDAPSYSNWGAALAGVIVEEVSGLGFYDYTEQRIFAPLGMDTATFQEPLNEDQIQALAEGVRRSSGLWEAQAFELISNFAPAGSMTVSGEDMATFMIAHLNEGRHGEAQLLARETTAQMHSQLYTQNEAVPGMAHGFYERLENGHRLLAHGGDTLWYHSNLILFPEADIGLFVSTNYPDGTSFRSNIVEAFMDEFFPGELEQADPVTDVDLTEYAGSYRFNRHAVSTIEKITVLNQEFSVSIDEDALLISRNDTTRRYEPIGDDVFQEIHGEGRIAFVRDETGEIRDLASWNLPIFSAYRLDSAQTTPIQLMLIGIPAFIFLNILVGSLIHVRRIFAMSAGERMARLTLIATAALQLGFIAGFFVLISSAGNDIVYGWPASMNGLLALPVIALPLTGLAAVQTVLAWKNGYWSVLGRLRYTVSTLAALLLYAFLAEYNLIGWNLV